MLAFCEYWILFGFIVRLIVTRIWSYFSCNLFEISNKLFIIIIIIIIIIIKLYC